MNAPVHPATRSEVAPLLAVEVVSLNHLYKDYVVAPEKYVACGAVELLVLDPLMCGPRADGGPYRIQVWRWLDEDRFSRVYAGEGPAWCEAVQGWVHATQGGSWFAICADESGREPWLTREEAAERRADAERAAKEALQREVAALKAQLGRNQ